MIDDYLSTPEERAQLEAEKEEREQFEADVRWVMGNVRGRRFASWILKTLCHVDMRAPADTTDMVRWEGGRDVGLALTEEIQRLCPSDFVHLRCEEMDNRRAADASRLKRLEDT